MYCSKMFEAALESELLIVILYGVELSFLTVRELMVTLLTMGGVFGGGGGGSAVDPKTPKL